MGDIINSRGLSDEVRERVTQATKSAFDRINTKYHGSFLADMGLVRGDSFEGVLITQYYAPQIIQDIIKSFYRVEKTLVRISVVMGQLTVRSSDRNEVDGPVFADVLAALNKLKERGSAHWLQVSFDIGTLGQSLIGSQIALLTALTERWTDKQREACWIAEEIEGHEAYPKDTAKKHELYKLVGNKLGIAPSVARKHLTAASYEAYRQAWDGLTAYLIAMDEYTAREKDVVQRSYIPYLNTAWYEMTRHNFEGALPILRGALMSVNNEPGMDGTHRIRIYILLADAYAQIQSFQSADDAIAAALALLEDMPKTTEHIEILKIQADILYYKMDYVGSILMLDKAIAIAQNILSQTSHLWMKLYSGIAMSYDSLKDYSVALHYYEKSLCFRKTILIEHYIVDYAVILLNIARCQCNVKKYMDASANAKKALQLFESNLPPRHNYITWAKNLLASINESQNTTYTQNRVPSINEIQKGEQQ